MINNSCINPWCADGCDDKYDNTLSERGDGSSLDGDGYCGISAATIFAAGHGRNGSILVLYN